jgi:hypothetical protein
MAPSAGVAASRGVARRAPKVAASGVMFYILACACLFAASGGVPLAAAYGVLPHTELDPVFIERVPSKCSDLTLTPPEGGFPERDASARSLNFSADAGASRVRATLASERRGRPA